MCEDVGMNNPQATPILNGNSFCKQIPHLFVYGVGCYLPFPVDAVKAGTSPNGVGQWMDSIEFEGQTWFLAGNLNVWD